MGSGCAAGAAGSCTVTIRSTTCTAAINRPDHTFGPFAVAPRAVMRHIVPGCLLKTTGGRRQRRQRTPLAPRDAGACSSSWVTAQQLDTGHLYTPAA